MSGSMTRRPVGPQAPRRSDASASSTPGHDTNDSPHGDPATLPAASLTPAERAAYFVEHETAFRLGVLPTEQPHPKTRGLAEAAQRDPREAVRMIQAVDHELLDVADRVFASDEFKKLALALTASLSPASNGRVFFTGCGATGRLSILLEACWRKACQRHDRADLEDRVFSVMAGGDFALIKSVEGYEDFSDFGRHQIDDTAGPRELNDADTVVAITEGGETSFVIGTAWRGLDAGASTFFVFNNPANVLAEHVERSRRVIEEAAITKLDLSVSPMAVAGSTRMQATTSELLVVGAALEMAFDGAFGQPIKPASHYRDSFATLLEQLETGDAVAAMADLAAYEADIYREERLVTYFADTLLLDVMTDTTERSPTFSLPPFRKRGDDEAPPSWSFVQNPAVDTDAAWRRLLGRDVRGIDWASADYAGMGAPAAIVDDPPALDADTIRTFPIGREPLPVRYPGAAVLLLTPDDDILDAARHAASRYAQTAALCLGTEPPAGVGQSFVVPLDSLDIDQDGPMRLSLHLGAKLALNTLSTVSMAVMGRLVSNWMVHVACTNKKLIDRGTRLIADQTGLPYADACRALHEAMATLAADPKLAARTSPVAYVIEKHPAA